MSVATLRWAQPPSEVKSHTLWTEPNLTLVAVVSLTLVVCASLVLVNPTHPVRFDVRTALLVPQLLFVVSYAVGGFSLCFKHSLRSFGAVLINSSLEWVKEAFPLLYTNPANIMAETWTTPASFVLTVYLVHVRDRWLTPDYRTASLLTALYIWLLVALPRLQVIWNRVVRCGDMIYLCLDFPRAVLGWGYIEPIVSELGWTHDNLRRLSRDSAHRWVAAIARQTRGRAATAAESNAACGTQRWRGVFVEVFSVVHTAAVWVTATMIVVGTFLLFAPPLRVVLVARNAIKAYDWPGLREVPSARDATTVGVAVYLLHEVLWPGLIGLLDFAEYLIRKALGVDQPYVTWLAEATMPVLWGLTAYLLLTWLSVQTFALWRLEEYVWEKDGLVHPPFGRKAAVSLLLSGAVGFVVARRCEPYVCGRTDALDAMSPTADVGANEWWRPIGCRPAVHVGLQTATAVNLVLLLCDLCLPYLARRAAQRNSMLSLRWLTWLLGPDVRYLDGPTPLQAAAAFGRLEAVRYLVDAGADIGTEKSALVIAANNLHADVVDFLLERGARLPHQGDPNGSTVYIVRSFQPDTPGIENFEPILWTLAASFLEEDCWVRAPSQLSLLWWLRELTRDLFADYEWVRAAYARAETELVLRPWTVRQHRISPKYAQRWVVNLMLCNRRPRWNHASPFSLGLPELPLELLFVILQHLYPGNMRLSRDNSRSQKRKFNER